MKFHLLDRDLLTAVDRARMFSLMEQHYDCIEPSQFEADLAWKDEVILLLDDQEQIQGFSTVALNPMGTGGPDYDIFYSGDTIVAREHWGSQELVHGFSRAAGRSKQPDRRLIWFLLSKGYRTYLYLTLFARRYFPALDPDRHDQSLAPIAARTAEQLFGQAWKEELGVVRFPASQGQLKVEMAEADASRPQVSFFLQRNPGFAEGDELVCATELIPENLRRHVRRGFEEGWRQRSEAKV